VSNAIREVVRERAIVKWEGASGLSPRAYVASKVFGLGAIAVVQAAFITFVATARQGAPGRAQLMVIAALAALAATVLGLALSAAVKSSDRATALLPVTLVLQLVLAGEWAANAQVPFLHQTRWIVGTRWAMEAMAGSLQGNTGQFWTAIGALVALLSAGVVATTVFVRRTIRPARHAALRWPRVPTGRLVAVASACAVVLSVSAGGAGVLALSHGGDATTSTPLVAAAPVTRRVTPVTTPTSIPAPVVAVTTPPVTAAPVRATVRTPVTVAIPETDIVAAPEPNIVTPEVPVTTPALLPTTPQATPATATPTSPLTGWLKLFTPFSLSSGR
jgi:hypothetical protein